MQKIVPVILIIAFGLLLANLIWTAIISQNISKVIEIVFSADTEFARTVEKIKNSTTVERISFTSRGTIKDIEDRALILEYEGSTLKIPVDINAQIVKQTEKEATPEMISFEDLQIGDEVSCSVEIKGYGRWSAYRVKLSKKGSDQ